MAKGSKPVQSSNNSYVNLLSSDLRGEYDNLKAEYKAARKHAKTMAEKKMIMQAYADDVIDLAIEARLAGEWELNRELNQLCDSLNRRTFTGKRGW